MSEASPEFNTDRLKLMVVPRFTVSGFKEAATNEMDGLV